jgi:hypothetical protein
MEYIDIYKIYCKDNTNTDIYVGSSVCARDRFYQHKSTCKNDKRVGHYAKIYNCIRENGGIDNWTYEVIERVEKPQQRIREQYWIQEINPSLNERRAYTDEDTAKELRKQHEAPIKEELAKKKREYRQKPEVREKELKKMKEWRENNVELRQELMKEWREKNKEHIAQYANEQYHKNKEKINARRRELRELKKQQQ